MSKGKDFYPRARPDTVAPPVTPSEVGDTYSITFERHAETPKLWRLRERSVMNGKVFENATDWLEFADFTPKLGMAQGRMKSFLFPQFGARLPVQVRRTT